MKSKKSLQKFTDADAKIHRLFSLEKITMDDLASLNNDEMEVFYKAATGKLNSLKGDERDRFIHKIQPILADDTRNQLWEHNHSQITFAISALMQEYGRMPTANEIAEKTGLSRQTVHKHLREYSNDPLYLMQKEKFRFMVDKVLARVFKYAVNGDMGAAKLYLNAMGFLNNQQAPNNTLIKNQNNYIQINGTILSQETIRYLNPEQLSAIETILKTAMGTEKKD